MAAKKKTDPAKGNEKPKSTPPKASTPAVNKTAAKKAEPELDDDFGLDDIELNPVDSGLDSIEEIKTPAPKVAQKTNAPAKPRATAKPKAQQKPKPQAKTAPKAPKTPTTPKAIPKAKVEATTKAAPINKPKPTPKTTITSTPVAKESEKEQKGSNRGLIVFFVIVLAAAAVYFLVFDKAEEKLLRPVEKKVEQAPVKVDPTPEPEPEVIPVPEPEPKAELVTISAPDGRFYVVVGSFYDDDLALDKGNEIVSSGLSAYLIEPTGEFKLFRVGIGVAQERSTAYKAREELKEKYGENIWVLKY